VFTGNSTSKNFAVAFFLLPLGAGGVSASSTSSLPHPSELPASTMATRASFFGKKLKDLNPMALLEPQTFLLRARQQMNRYSAAYIRTGSFTPVIHATLFFGSTGMMFQYFVRGRTSSFADTNPVQFFLA
jgi:hypothetical protein